MNLITEYITMNSFALHVWPYVYVSEPGQLACELIKINLENANLINLGSVHAVAAVHNNRAELRTAPVTLQQDTMGTLHEAEENSEHIRAPDLAGMRTANFEPMSESTAVAAAPALTFDQQLILMREQRSLEEARQQTQIAMRARPDELLRIEEARQQTQIAMRAPAEDLLRIEEARMTPRQLEQHARLVQLRNVAAREADERQSRMEAARAASRKEEHERELAHKAAETKARLVLEKKQVDLERLRAQNENLEIKTGVRVIRRAGANLRPLASQAAPPTPVSPDGQTE
jgi:hypothetical protein